MSQNSQLSRSRNVDSQRQRDVASRRPRISEHHTVRLFWPDACSWHWAAERGVHIHGEFRSVSGPTTDIGVILPFGCDPAGGSHCKMPIRSENFIVTLGGAVAWPLAVMPVIGFSGTTTA